MFLKKEIESLRQNITTNNSKIHGVPKDEYIKLEQENVKLKHRIAILIRVCSPKAFRYNLKHESLSDL